MKLVFRWLWTLGLLESLNVIMFASRYSWFYESSLPPNRPPLTPLVATKVLQRLRKPINLPYNFPPLPPLNHNHHSFSTSSPPPIPAPHHVYHNPAPCYPRGPMDLYFRIPSFQASLSGIRPRLSPTRPERVSGPLLASTQILHLPGHVGLVAWE